MSGAIQGTETQLTKLGLLTAAVWGGRWRAGSLWTRSFSPLSWLRLFMNISFMPLAIAEEQKIHLPSFIQWVLYPLLGGLLLLYIPQFIQQLHDLKTFLNTSLRFSLFIFSSEQMNCLPSIWGELRSWDNCCTLHPSLWRADTRHANRLISIMDGVNDVDALPRLQPGWSMIIMALDSSDILGMFVSAKLLSPEVTIKLLLCLNSLPVQLSYWHQWCSFWIGNQIIVDVFNLWL